MHNARTTSPKKLDHGYIQSRNFTATTVFLQPVGTGRYDSLQAQLQRRFTNGFSLNVNYALGRALSPNENSSWTPNVQAIKYLDRNYAPTSTDRRHNLGITSVWQLPFGQGRRWLVDKGALSAIVGAGKINNMFSIMSGVPFTVYADGTSLNLPGSNQTADLVKSKPHLGTPAITSAAGPTS